MACGRAPGSRPQRTQEQKLGLWTRMAETQRGWGTPEQGRVGGQRATKPAANRWAEEAFPRWSWRAPRGAGPAWHGPVVFRPRGVGWQGLLLQAPRRGGHQRGPAGVAGSCLLRPARQGEDPAEGPLKRVWGAKGAEVGGSTPGGRDPECCADVLWALGSPAKPPRTQVPGAYPTEKDRRSRPQGPHGPKTSSFPPTRAGQVENSRGQW